MAASAGPVKIVEWHPEKNVKLTLNSEALQRVLQPVEDNPVVIISICGAFRTGKSFLLNYLLKYLEGMEREQMESTEPAISWLKKEEELTGFEWGQGTKATTTGILLWNRPFLLTGEDGKKVGVILMDTQGLFDEYMTTEDAVVMITLSTLMSSIQIYNVLGMLREDHLKHFELFLEAGTRALNDNLELPNWKPFQRLVFLVRDWIDPMSFPFGEVGGADYLKEKSEEAANEAGTLRENLNRCFERVECFLMPFPGVKATQTTTVESESDEDEDECTPFRGEVSKLSRPYVKHLRKVADFLIKRSNVTSHTKKWGDQQLTGDQVMQLMIQHMAAFQKGAVPTPGETHQNMMDVLNKPVLEKAIEKAEENVHQILDQFDKYYPTNVEWKFNEIIENAEETFCKKSKGTKEEKAIFIDKCKQDVNRIVEVGKLTYRLKLSKRQEQDKKKCMEAAAHGKIAFRDRIKQLIQNPKTWEGSDLELIYRQAKDTILTCFKNDINNCVDAQSIAETQLIEYCEDELEKALEEQRLSRECKNEEEKLIKFQTQNDSVNFYQNKMDKIYGNLTNPEPEEAIKQDHEKFVLQAKRRYLDKIGEIDEGSTDTIEGKCRARLQFYLQVNREVLQVSKENALLQWHMIKEKALCVYQENMEKTLKFGKTYKTGEELRHYHSMCMELSIHEVKVKLQDMMLDRETCLQELKADLSEKYKRLEEYNELNNSSRLPNLDNTRRTVVQSDSKLAKFFKAIYDFFKEKL